MWFQSSLLAVLSTASSILAQDAGNYTIREDTLGYDAALEVVHIYTGQWPTGMCNGIWDRHPTPNFSSFFNLPLYFNPLLHFCPLLHFNPPSRLDLFTTC